MNASLSDRPTADIAALLRRLSPAYAPTPLSPALRIAERYGIAAVTVKDETGRTLGSFKSLGGTYAGLCALSRAAGIDLSRLIDEQPSLSHIPPLITASAGNHGLAVAAAARYVGHRARIYLYPGVLPARVARIAAQGAEIVQIQGTYDDAVARAAADAKTGQGILVADTSERADDPMIADVMAGYGVMADEIRGAANELPTHLFIQAGVGGLAAALAKHLHRWLAPPARIVVIEPTAASCVGAALDSGRRHRIRGTLDTAAGMLACGEISTPAFDILRRAEAQAVAVGEDTLSNAVRVLSDTTSIASTPSGAAGLAGLIHVSGNPALRRQLALDGNSHVLIVVTEAQLEG